MVSVALLRHVSLAISDAVMPFSESTSYVLEWVGESFFETSRLRDSYSSFCILFSSVLKPEMRFSIFSRKTPALACLSIVDSYFSTNLSWLRS